MMIESNIMRNASMIREVDVRISGTSWKPELPTVQGIEEKLQRIRSIENSTQRSLELMLAIMKGQYFEDGNKRTAQLVANHEMIRSGVGGCKERRQETRQS